MDLTIATTTQYRSMDDPRAELALKMLKTAVNMFYLSAVVDDGSCREFRDRLVPHSHTWIKFFHQEQKGMGASRRQAIRCAAEVTSHSEAIFWTEPEKWPIIPQLTHIARTMEMTKADIVVPARKSFASYPPIQQSAERLGNMYFAKTTGCELDMWIGPRLIGPRALPYFLDYKGEYGDKWDSIFIPVIRAIADGLKVVSCDVDYVHPPEQTAAEETDPDMDLKRLAQLQNLVPSFYAEAKKLGLLKTGLQTA